MKLMVVLLILLFIGILYVHSVFALQIYIFSAYFRVYLLFRPLLTKKGNCRIFA